MNILALGAHPTVAATPLLGGVLERALGSRTHAVLMIFLLSIAFGLTGLVLRSAGMDDVLLLLVQAASLVVVVVVLERRGRSV